MTDPQLPAEHPDDPMPAEDVPSASVVDAFDEPGADPTYMPPAIEDDDGDPA